MKCIIFGILPHLCKKKLFFDYNFFKGRFPPLIWVIWGKNHENKVSSRRATSQLRTQARSSSFRGMMKYWLYRSDRNHGLYAGKPLFLKKGHKNPLKGFFKQMKKNYICGMMKCWLCANFIQIERKLWPLCRKTLIFERRKGIKTLKRVFFSEKLGSHF